MPTLNISKSKSFPNARNNLDPILSVIKYFDKHQSIVKIKAKEFDSSIHFRKKLAVMKSKRLSVISTWKRLTNKKIFPLRSQIAKFIAENVNSCNDKGELPAQLKAVDIVPTHEKKLRVKKVITDKSGYYLVTLKYMKN